VRGRGCCNLVRHHGEVPVQVFEEESLTTEESDQAEPRSGAELIAKAGIPTTLPSGEPDTGLLIAASGKGETTFGAFKGAIAAHRHFARETDPPRV
jgi:hypothetical protein